MRVYNQKQDEHANHVNEHFLAAQVKMFIGVALFFRDEFCVLSIDRKAVIPYGTVAVSGRLKVPSYSEKPHPVPDQTWAAEHTVLPFGITQPRLIVDDIRRSYLKTLRSGNLTFFLRTESNPLLDC